MIQCSDPEATARAYAFGRHNGFDPTDIIEDNDYDEEGVAKDNFTAGWGLPAIMQAYRWRDARTVLRYGAKLATKCGASARLAKRFET